MLNLDGIKIMSAWDPVLLKSNGNHQETQRNKLVTPLDPDSSSEKCCSVDVLITHFPLGIINTGLHMGAASICSLNLRKDGK